MSIVIKIMITITSFFFWGLMVSILGSKFHLQEKKKTKTTFSLSLSLSHSLSLSLFLVFL